MFITALLRAKVKSKNVLVLCESMASGHRLTTIRERNEDKLEFIRFDPTIQQESIYKELKKLRSVKIITKQQKAKKTTPLSLLTEEI